MMVIKALIRSMESVKNSIQTLSMYFYNINKGNLCYFTYIIIYIDYYGKYRKEVLDQQGLAQAISPHLSRERFSPSGTVLRSLVTFGGEYVVGLM